MDSQCRSTVKDDVANDVSNNVAGDVNKYGGSSARATPITVEVLGSHTQRLPTAIGGKISRAALTKGGES